MKDRLGQVLRVGDRVQVNQPIGRPLGTWLYFEGCVGTLVTVNRVDGELGVEWGGCTRWFTAHEVVRLETECLTSWHATV